MYCPALTDGSIGDMIYFHSYRNPGLVLDIAGDIRGMNDEAIRAKKTGVIILGGGLIKHHILNANLMRNGTDFAVFINTGQEFDGSDGGARPDEAISWGKIKINTTPVKVCTLFYKKLITKLVLFGSNTCVSTHCRANLCQGRLIHIYARTSIIEYPLPTHIHYLNYIIKLCKIPRTCCFT